MVLRNRIAHNTPKNHGFAYSPARARHRSRFLFWIKCKHIDPRLTKTTANEIDQFSRPRGSVRIYFYTIHNPDGERSLVKPIDNEKKQEGPRCQVGLTQWRLLCQNVCRNVTEPVKGHNASTGRGARGLPQTKISTNLSARNAERKNVLSRITTNNIISETHARKSLHCIQNG